MNISHCPFCQSADTHVFTRSLIDYDNKVRTTLDCANCGMSFGFVEKATTEDKTRLKPKDDSAKPEPTIPPQQPLVFVEKGWLIEFNYSGVPYYVLYADEPITVNTSKADVGLRFARKSDAELFMDMFPIATEGAKVTEHEWVRPAL